MAAAVYKYAVILTVNGFQKDYKYWRRGCKHCSVHHDEHYFIIQATAGDGKRYICFQHRVLLDTWCYVIRVCLICISVLHKNQ